MADTSLPSYVPLHHAAWLKAHPHRDVAWLKRMTEDGFDIHHIDGDRDNNDPDNLVLIEHTDHMRLHGRTMLGHIKVPSGRKPLSIEDIARGKPAYMTRSHGGVTWAEIAMQWQYPDALAAMNAALRYAKHHGLPWPIGGGPPKTG